MAKVIYEIGPNRESRNRNETRYWWIDPRSQQGHKVCLLVLDLSVLDQFLYTLYKIQLGSARWIVRRDQFVKVMRGNTRDVLVAMQYQFKSAVLLLGKGIV